MFAVTVKSSLIAVASVDLHAMAHNPLAGEIEPGKRAAPGRIRSVTVPSAVLGWLSMSSVAKAAWSVARAVLARASTSARLCSVAEVRRRRVGDPRPRKHPFAKPAATTDTTNRRPPPPGTNIFKGFRRSLGF